MSNAMNTASSAACLSILGVVAVTAPSAAAGERSFPIPSAAWSSDDEPDEPEDSEEPEDLDKPAKPASPRDGTSFSITVPLGIGGGSSGTGFAYGISGTIGGGAFSVPLYVVIANDGHAGGIYEAGVRYSAPKLFFAELLVGFVKADAYYGASLGVGAGIGLDIPVYKHFTITVGTDVSYAFAQAGVFALLYGGPTLHI